MNFHNINLPRFIEVFATGGPHFTSSLASTLSGRELIIMDCEFAKQKYVIKDCVLSELEFEQFNAFFRARKGKAFAFRFRDLGDYKVTKQLLATGDGILKSFPLFKLYEDPVISYKRRISKPIEGTVNLFINNEPLNAIIDYEKGVVELDDSLALNETLIADFMFDVVVRFGSDNFEYNFSSDGTVKLSEIELIEVIE